MKALAAGTALLIAALWLRWWLQPERQIPRAQARLLSSVETRDFDALAGMIAGDYHDRWQQNRATVVVRSREVFVEFAMLTIVRDPRGLREESGRWLLAEKVTLKGIGGPLAMLARDAVNALRAPFVMEWRRRSWKPWDWELESIAQPELDLPTERDGI